MRRSAAAAATRRRGRETSVSAADAPRSQWFAVAGILSCALAVAEPCWRALAHWWSLNVFGLMAESDFDYQEAVTLILGIGAAMSVARVYILWMLGRLLEQFADFRGSDKYVLLLVAFLLVDTAVLMLRLNVESVRYDPLLATSIHELPIPPTRFTFSYTSLAFWALGVLLMALGFSLLRLRQSVLGWSRWYAYSQIATGAAYTASLGAWALAASVPGHLFLAGCFFAARKSPQAPR